MKIAMWTAFLVEETPERAVEILSECGYRYAELSDEHGAMLMERGNPVETGRRFRETAESCGISLPQGHLKLAADIAAADPAARRRDLDYLKREIELYRAAGVRAAVLHCGGGAALRAGVPEEEVEGVRTEALRELCDAAGDGIRIALENLSRSVSRSAAELLHIIELAGRPELGVCLDTGHLNLTGGDPVEFIETVGGKLIALHITDNLGESDLHMFPCGRGNIRWQPLMRKLRASGYDGLFNFEVPGERCAFRPIALAKLRYALELGTLMHEL